MSTTEQVNTPWMGSKAAAAYLDTTQGKLAVDRHKKVGVRFYRYGRKIIYKRSDLDSYLEQFACEPGEVKTEEVGS